MVEAPEQAFLAFAEGAGPDFARPDGGRNGAIGTGVAHRHNDLPGMQAQVLAAFHTLDLYLAGGHPQDEAVFTVALNQVLWMWVLQPILRTLVPPATKLEIICGDEVFFVPGTSGLIDQVVVNLVVNARDATPPGGTICVMAVLSSRSPGMSWGREYNTTTVFRGPPATSSRLKAAAMGQRATPIKAMVRAHLSRQDQGRDEDMESMVAAPAGWVPDHLIL